MSKRGEDKRQQLELFRAAIVDANLRDERDAMEFPMFSLEKRKRTKPLHYNRHGVEILVTAPAESGIATIWDADFIVWLATQLNAAINRGQAVSPRMWVSPNQFLVETGRIGAKRGGAVYEEFAAMLHRLQSTSVYTNIQADGTRHEKAWSWITEYDYEEKREGQKRRPIGLTVQIPMWLFQRIVKDRSVLAIAPEYFDLSRGIERWLYRVARKLVGRDVTWEIPLRELHARYPGSRDYRLFKHDIKDIVAKSTIPEYALAWVEAREAIAFIRRPDAVRETPQISGT